MQTGAHVAALLTSGLPAIKVAAQLVEGELDPALWIAVDFAPALRQPGEHVEIEQRQRRPSDSQQAERV